MQHGPPPPRPGCSGRKCERSGVAVRSSRGIERAAPAERETKPPTGASSLWSDPQPGPSVTYVTQQYAKNALTVPVVTPAR